MLFSTKMFPKNSSKKTTITLVGIVWSFNHNLSFLFVSSGCKISMDFVINVYLHAVTYWLAAFFKGLVIQCFDFPYVVFKA